MIGMVIGLLRFVAEMYFWISSITMPVPVALSRILEVDVSGGLLVISMRATSRVTPPVLFSYLSAKLANAEMEASPDGFRSAVDMFAGRREDRERLDLACQCGRASYLIYCSRQCIHFTFGWIQSSNLHSFQPCSLKGLAHMRMGAVTRVTLEKKWNLDFWWNSDHMAAVQMHYPLL